MREKFSEKGPIEAELPNFPYLNKEHLKFLQFILCSPTVADNGHDIYGSQILQ